MSVRTRLMILTILGLAVTMAVWGWVQIRALDQILVEEQGKRLSSVAETVGTYYQHFPTGQGLSTLDATLKEQIQTDVRMARIDIFTVVKNDIDYIAGASRVSYEWPESLVGSVAASRKPRYIRLQTEDGPAVGLLYPVTTEKSRATQFVVGVINFSRANAEILSRAKYLLVTSTVWLLLIILLVLAASYRWLIGRPLGIIIRTIDEFQTGQYVKRIPITPRDEWGHLSENFNSMAPEVETREGSPHPTARPCSLPSSSNVPRRRCGNAMCRTWRLRSPAGRRPAITAMYRYASYRIPGTRFAGSSRRRSSNWTSPYRGSTASKGRWMCRTRVAAIARARPSGSARPWCTQNSSRTSHRSPRTSPRYVAITFTRRVEELGSL